MSIFYTSERVGKHGKIFRLYKIRTLKEGRGDYAHKRDYVWGGKFMRKWRIDELPQVWNMVRGDMGLCGPRPQEAKVINLYPSHIRDKILSVKPGLFGLAGIHFMDEEHILKLSDNPDKDYWEKIAPIKMTLDIFYVENKSFLFDLVIIWLAVKRRIKTAWTTH